MSYVPLRCRSNYSFLEGASHPEELVQRAAELGLEALALTDRDGLYGIVRAQVVARDLGVKLIVGAEMTVARAGPLLLLAPDLEAYGDLCELITLGRRSAPKGHSLVGLEDVLAASSRLLAVAVDRVDEARLTELKEGFGDRLYLGVGRHLEEGEEALLAATEASARRHGLPLVVANDVLMHSAERKALHDVLGCIRRGDVLQQAGQRHGANAERRLHSPQDMSARFPDLAEALERSREIAARCHFSLDEIRYDYPSEVVPEGSNPREHLRQLVALGLARRYPGGVSPAVQAQIEHELGLIESLDYPNYFLTMEEIVAFARSQGILCQGRGSAANSAVCYALGITSVDPARSNMLFERFISAERDEPPDIDVDFEHERREEVIQHIYEKYGRDRAGMVAEVVRYRGRSAIRDAGKAVGLPLDLVDRMARSLSHWSASEDLAAAASGKNMAAGIDLGDPTVALALRLASELRFFPRHLSIHVGGFVISNRRLERLVPIENATKEGRTVIQWDKIDVEEAGLLKIDVLALGMLTAIRKTFTLLAEHDGLALELATVPAEDPITYAMIQHADTIGTFQIESRAQMSMLPRLRPKCFYDLVIEVAIMRPGPIQGKMVHPYLRRRHGLEPVEYPHPSTVPVLERTCGVPLFQEQVMELAVVAAGFTPGEADQLRRAMGSWRSQGKLRILRQKLLAGMRERGITDDFAARVVQQIEGFGDYGFPESHAASFAILAYVSAWLKRHHQAPFLAALLNSQPMGFYAAHSLVADAQNHGVEIRSVHVQHSAWDCSLEPGRLGAIPRATEASFTVEDQPRWAVRLGLRMVRGLAREVGERLAAACAERPFSGLRDLLLRVRPPRDVPLRLAAVGALQGLDGMDSRREAIWRVQGEGLVRDDLLQVAKLVEPPVQLAPMDDVAVLRADYEGLGLSVDLHPMEPLRGALEQRGVTHSRGLARMRHGQAVRVAGLVIVRQGPGTAKGMKFLTLEDEHGYSNLVVRPHIYERFRVEIRSASLLLAEGHVEREGRVIHVMTQRVVPLHLGDRDLPSRSRDFH